MTGTSNTSGPALRSANHPVPSRPPRRRCVFQFAGAISLERKSGFSTAPPNPSQPRATPRLNQPSRLRIIRIAAAHVEHNRTRASTMASNRRVDCRLFRLRNLPSRSTTWRCCRPGYRQRSSACAARVVNVEFGPRSMSPSAKADDLTTFQSMAGKTIMPNPSWNHSRKPRKRASPNRLGSFPVKLQRQ